jgi:hypothetical protein
MRQRELAEKREEEQRDLWFTQIRPMTKVKQTWHERWLAREENGNSSDNSSEEEVEVISDKGESTSDMGNSNSNKGSNPDKVWVLLLLILALVVLQVIPQRPRE